MAVHRTVPLSTRVTPSVESAVETERREAERVARASVSTSAIVRDLVERGLRDRRRERKPDA